MYNNQNFNPFGTTMPTATQPYGYSMNNMPNYMQAQMPQQQQNQSNSNMVFVSGLEDVKKRFQAPNSEMYYADNDKPLLYKKIVYPNGQFDVKMFTISEYKVVEEQKENIPIDLSHYAKTTDLEAIQGKLNSLEEQIKKLKQGGTSNGTIPVASTTTRPTIVTK